MYNKKKEKHIYIILSKICDKFDTYTHTLIPQVVI